MAGTTWPDLVAGRTAKASEVESKFDWLEGNLVPMLSGTTTDLAYDLGTETKRWRYAYVSALNPTSTAGGVAIGTTTAHASTILDLSGAKAFRVPRLSSTQRDALTGADGMVIFNSTTSQLQVFRNAAWGNIGGTVFRTNALAQTSSSSEATTSVLSVASGGGRVNGIRVHCPNATGKPNLQVVLDGVTVLNWTAATQGAYTYFVGPSGEVNRQPGGATTTSGEFSGTSSPFLGWDFATSASIYIREAAGLGPLTNTVAYVYSSIV